MTEHSWMTIWNLNLEANKANAPIHIQMGQYKQQQQCLRNMHLQMVEWSQNLYVKSSKEAYHHAHLIIMLQKIQRLVLIISLTLTFGHCISSCINNANMYKYSLLKFCPYAKFDSDDMYCVWENYIDWIITWTHIYPTSPQIHNSMT